jgi:hypothetical protein
MDLNRELVLIRKRNHILRSNKMDLESIKKYELKSEQDLNKYFADKLGDD